MFRNIGKKVKVLAWILFVLGVILSAALAACIIIMAVNPEFGRVFTTVMNMQSFSSLSDMSVLSGVIAGVIVFIIGFLISWINNWIIYAIGEAADNKGQIDYLLLVLDDRKAKATMSKK